MTTKMTVFDDHGVHNNNNVTKRQTQLLHCSAGVKKKKYMKKKKKTLLVFNKPTSGHRCVLLDYRRWVRIKKKKKNRT